MKENRKTHKIISVCFLVLMMSVITAKDIRPAQAQEMYRSIYIEKPKITQISQDQLIDECIKIEPFIPYFEITEEERAVVEHIVSGEAKGESYLGQVLVAQCILNACLQDGLRPDEVRVQYQYSGWSKEVSDETKQAVSDVFDYGKLAVDDNILWFYAPKYTKGKFHNTQKFIIQEGGHKFFAPWN